MQFQVPQFIEVEDKVIGGILTLRQFIYLAGSAGLGFIIYKSLPSIYISGIPILAVVGSGVALAFAKVNGKPLINTVEAAFKYFFAKKLFIWHKRDRAVVASAKSDTAEADLLYVPRLSDSKLKDLTWSLDIKESLNPVTRDNK